MFQFFVIPCAKLKIIIISFLSSKNLKILSHFYHIQQFGFSASAACKTTLKFLEKIPVYVIVVEQGS